MVLLLVNDDERRGLKRLSQMFIFGSAAFLSPVFSHSLSCSARKVDNKSNHGIASVLDLINLPFLRQKDYFNLLIKTLKYDKNLQDGKLKSPEICVLFVFKTSSLHFCLEIPIKISRVFLKTLRHLETTQNNFLAKSDYAFLCLDKCHVRSLL